MIILLAEREPVLRLTFTVLLEHAGHTVISAESAAVALRAFTRVKPDVVVTELNLHDTDGHVRSIVRDFRRLDGSVPILATSAALDPEESYRALDQGATRFLRKPVSGDRLVKELRSLESTGSAR